MPGECLFCESRKGECLGHDIAFFNCKYIPRIGANVKSASRAMRVLLKVVRMLVKATSA